MRRPPDLRTQLEPHIRRVGVREVARLSGVQASGISRWLGGDRDMRVSSLESIARAVRLHVCVVPRDAVIRRRRRA